MADVTVINDSSSVNVAYDGRQTVKVSASVHYYFYKAVAGKDVKYVKSSDGGATWGSPVTIASATNFIGVPTVWYDKWTPGQTGNLIHVAYARDGVDGMYHRSLLTTADALSSEGSIDTGVVSGTKDRATMAKSRGGNLYCAYDAGSTARGFARSTDNGLNWTAKADPWSGEGTGDGERMLLFPGNESDQDDMWLVWWDDDAQEISLKTYDDSGNSFSEATIDTSMDPDQFAVFQSMSGAIRHSDNHLILVAHSDDANAAHDFKVYDINGAASITAKTNIFTAVTDKFAACVTIDTGNDAIYVGYVVSTTPFTVQHGVYVKSMDGGTSWGAEVTTNVTDRRYFAICDDLGSVNNTVFQPVIWDTTSADAFTNLATSVAIGGGAAGSADVTVTDESNSLFGTSARGQHGVIWADDQEIGYFFYPNDNVPIEIRYVKTLNGGDTWGAPVLVSTAGLIANLAFSSWYDRWTPGDTGTKIHLAFHQDNSAKMVYRSLDTADDSLSAAVNITAAVLSDPPANISITKSRGGELAVIWNSSSAVIKSDFFISDDDGATWDNKLDPWNASSSDNHEVYLFPSDEDDPNDVWAIVQNNSVNALQFWVYSRGSDSWKSQTIEATWSTSVGGNIGTAISHTTRHLWLSGISGNPFATPVPLRVWEIGGIDQIEEKTNVISSNDYLRSNIFVDQGTDDVYVAYGRGADVSNLVARSKVSHDNGATWESETTEGDGTTYVMQRISVSPGVTGRGRWLVCWFDTTLDDIFTNTSNAVNLGVARTTQQTGGRAVIPGYQPFFGGAGVDLDFDFQIVEWKGKMVTKALALNNPGHNNDAVSLNFVYYTHEIKGRTVIQHSPHPISLGHEPDFIDLEEMAIMWNKDIPTVKPRITLKLTTLSRTYQGVITAMTIVEEGGTSRIEFQMKFETTWTPALPVLREWN
ncbi:hypothetical protein LCGC14_0263840 [marine sediment metagenome]|uniref:Sialidase domain-containing protein n=1 Tax=marine sediment metagenome TaxID=412755 RepID=A0A0F9U0T8_9ZZZZ